ncbi:MAG: hypothetical protein R3B93_19185 [Bacteroidia bacterium]
MPKEDKIQRPADLGRDGQVSVQENIKANQTITFDHKNAGSGNETSIEKPRFFSSINPQNLQSKLSA